MDGSKVSTFRERFTELISSSPKSQSAIAAEFGVAKQTISAWLTGQSSPRSPVIMALSDYFNVSVAWLMGYDVPKTEDTKAYEAYSRAVDGALEKQNRLFPLSDEEEAIINAYRSLDQDGKKYLLQQASIASAMFGGKGQTDSSSKSG